MDYKPLWIFCKKNFLPTRPLPAKIILLPAKGNNFAGKARFTERNDLKIARTCPVAARNNSIAERQI